MEAGKERLTRDTVRDATRQEIEHLKRENHDGRTTTEEPRSETTGCRPFPGGPPLQKNSHPSFRWGRRRMSAQERPNIISRVEETRWGERKILTQLQVPKSTYYRWRARAPQGKQDSSTSSTRIPWNKLSPPEVATVLAAARESPEWSSRQLAT